MIPTIDLANSLLGRGTGSGAGDGYATWDTGTATALMSLSGGNRTAAANTSNYECVRSTKNDFNTSSGGKFYWEVVVDTLANAADIWLGVKRTADSAEASGSSPFTGSGGFALLRGNSDELLAGDWTAPGTPGAYAAGDVVMIALDCDTGKMWFGENGTWYQSGDPAAGTNPSFESMNAATDFCAFFSTDNLAGAVQVTLVANPAGLTYSAPSGFTAGLPA